MHQVVEINGHKARVAVFTSGIRSFTMSPFVFTSFKNTLDYGSLNVDQTVYLLVKAAISSVVGFDNLKSGSRTSR